MSSKILVADDSQTIQKVVGITLSDTEHELYQALDEDELVNTLAEENFDLLLLDFNLSESKPGFDLLKYLREREPNLPILIMLGTFDSVDESQMSEYSPIDKIVKPFESAKFLDLCESLMSQNLEGGEETADVEEEASDSEEALLEFSDEGEEEEAQQVAEDLEFGGEETPEEIEAVEENEVEEEDGLGEGWEVEAPEQPEEEAGFHVDEVEETPEAEFSPGQNPLENEIEGWGMEVPSIIGSEESEGIFPPVIEEVASEEVAALPSEEDTVLPSEEDTAYPDEEDAAYPDEDDMAYPGEEPSQGPELTHSVSEEYSSDFAITEEETGEDIEESLQSESHNQTINLDLDTDDSSDDVLNLETTSGEVTTVPTGEEADMSLPNEDDLNYPDMGDYQGTVVAPTSKLVSMDELAPDDEEEEVLEKTDPQYQVPPSSEELANEINADSNPDEFWAVDDESGGGIDQDATTEFKIDDFVSGAGAVADLENFQRQEEEFKKKQKELNKASEEIFEIEVDNDVIAEKIKEQVMPVLEELIKEVCREKVEQIAWEVIPDLAQNLITKEIKTISDSISDQ